MTYYIYVTIIRLEVQHTEKEHHVTSATQPADAASSLASTTHGAPDAPTGQVPRPRQGRPALTLIAVSFGLFMVGLDSTVVHIANPAIQADLGPPSVNCNGSSTATCSPSPRS